MAAATTPHAGSRPGWFAVPAPVRGLFNVFPLRVYGPEALPVRAPSATRARPTLYVFVANEDAPYGYPSFNPSCLKWQVCSPPSANSSWVLMLMVDCEHRPS